MHLVLDGPAIHAEAQNRKPQHAPLPPLFTKEELAELDALCRRQAMQAENEAVPDARLRQELIDAFHALEPAALANAGRLELDIDDARMAAALTFTGRQLSECHSDPRARALPQLLQTFLDLAHRSGVLFLTAQGGRFTLRLDADLAACKPAHGAECGGQKPE